MNRFVVCTLVVIAVVFGACSKSDSSTTPTPTPTYSMTAKLDGANFQSQTGGALGTLQSDSTFSVQGYVTIGATKQVALTIVGAKAGTTYAIGSDTSVTCSVTLGTSIEQTFFANIASGTGTITLSRLTDTEAEGTFSFTARNLNGLFIAVTEGKFLVKMMKI